VPIATTEQAATEQSTSGSLDDISWVQEAASQLYRRNVPLLHTSTQRPGVLLQVISFTRPSPTLVLQAAKAVTKRPGYEAR